MFATGYIARTGFKLCWGKYDAFYMMGSMGLAPSIACGTALSVRKYVVCVNGDGAHMMMPNMLCPHVKYYVLNNDGYESTGGQCVPGVFGGRPWIPHEIAICKSPPDPRISVHPREITHALMGAICGSGHLRQLT